jgi:hypothetical protein
MRTGAHALAGKRHRREYSMLVTTILVATSAL